VPASSPVGLLLALAAAAVAGAINAIAGGGTLVSFPAIVALGVPPLVANATNAVALWPGAFGSLWAYRSEVSGARTWAARFAVPSSVGGAVGAVLLLWTPSDRFERVVPFLVLGATVLFMAQGPITRRLRSSGSPTSLRSSYGGPPKPRRRRKLYAKAEGDDTKHFDVPGNALPPPPLTYLLYQFGVGIYGGYFGAGIGILMLAVLGAMGLTNIHRMNGLKNWGALCINAVAALIFSVSGVVNWPFAIVMAVGGVIGGYGGAWLAQRVAQAWVRRAISAIGLSAFVWLLLKQ
jgi:uncharacterized membrane protein YfcA